MLFVTALLSGFVATGCGGASPDSAPQTSSRAVGVRDAAGARAPARADSARDTPSTAHYLNDGDGEQEDAADGDGRADNDKDPSLDYAGAGSDHNPGEDSRYHDVDDSAVLTSGRAASPSDERAVAAAVERYYAAAVAGEGRKACSMLLASLAMAVPLDYGQAPGPPYLRGGRTCAAVLTSLFKHYRRQLAAPIAVTGVRAEGENGQMYALLGSTTTPASVMIVQRVGSNWKMAQLLGLENGLP